MKFRQWFADKPVVVVAIAVIALGIAGYQLLISNRKRPPIAHLERWYMDMETGEFVTYATDNPASPIELPNGNTGVIAHFFSCADCSDESSRFFGYVQKVNIPPDATHAANQIDAEFGNRPKDYFSTDGKQWYVQFSDKANAITSAPVRRCGGASPQRCDPS